MFFSIICCHREGGGITLFQFCFFGGNDSPPWLSIFYLFIIHKQRCRPLGRQTPVYSFKLRLQKTSFTRFPKDIMSFGGEFERQSLSSWKARGKASQVGSKGQSLSSWKARGKASQVEMTWLYGVLISCQLYLFSPLRRTKVHSCVIHFYHL